MQEPRQKNSNNVVAMDFVRRRNGVGPGPGGIGGPDEQGNLYDFSGSKERLAAELTSVNAMFFLSISELHLTILDKLRGIPRKFMTAAESLAGAPHFSESSTQWTKVMTLHVQTLSFSCEPVMEIARLHNLRKQGAEVVGAIHAIEDALPRYLEVVALRASSGTMLPDPVTLFEPTFAMLDQHFVELHATVSSSITRANSLVVAPRSLSGRP
ncbi:MAG: hypothetical protein OEZ03_06405 [Alphaproteobacteria bacterium]|nr:hypothetical protein [Alphaproteobacteria bacterium]